MAIQRYKKMQILCVNKHLSDIPNAYNLFMAAIETGVYIRHTYSTLEYIRDRHTFHMVNVNKTVVHLLIGTFTKF